MPYHAWAVSKSKPLMWWQIGISVLWAYSIFYDYITEIPEGENGSVIIGMFMVFPFLCLLSQVIFFASHYIFNKAVNRCRLAYNKSIN
jgi:hypothetical protein